MPQVGLIDPRTPLGQRLSAAPGYPLKGSALAAIAAFALSHYILLVPWIGWILDLAVWAMTFVYALACLHHTANGFADPPELSPEDNNDGGWAVVALMVLVIAMMMVAKMLWSTAASWLIALVFALIAPAIVMALAFGDEFSAALNPGKWVVCITRIGMPYLLLVVIQLITYALQGELGVVVGNALPWLLAIPVVHAITNYAIFLNFHLMGVFMHRYHEAFGFEPEAPQLMRASGHGVDTALIEHARMLAAQGEGAAAAEMFRQRLRERKAHADVHLAYRQVLRSNGQNDELLAHAQPCIASLVADGKARRALGVVQECVELKPDFMPNDPSLAGKLADTAAQAGMWKLALKLARGYPNTWPDAAGAPRYGLLAAQILAEHMGKPNEALVLAQKLASAFPQCKERADIDAFMRGLAGNNATP